MMCTCYFLLIVQFCLCEESRCSKFAALVAKHIAVVYISNGCCQTLIPSIIERLGVAPTDAVYSRKLFFQL